MRKAACGASLLIFVSALCACSRRQEASEAPKSPPKAVQPQPAPEPRPAVEAAAATAPDAGAYGMPRAPIPYDQLPRYEQRQAMADPDAAPRPPIPMRWSPSTG